MKWKELLITLVLTMIGVYIGRSASNYLDRCEAERRQQQQTQEKK
jgi:hypothetical protein